MDNFVIDRCDGFQAIFMNWTSTGLVFNQTRSTQSAMP